MNLVSSFNPIKISKAVKFTGKNVSEAVETVAQPIIEETEKIIQKVATTPTIMPEFKLAKNPKISNFSQSFKEEINLCRQRIWQSLSSNKNQHKIFTNIDTFLENLINYCPDEKVLKQIISDDKKFNIYINRKSKLNKFFKKSISLNCQDKNEVLTKLFAMSIVNPESFKAICKSKGSKSILNGELNISYLKNIDPLGKYDENFLYKMFETLENSANERLAKGGFDVDIINKYFKASDKYICTNPMFRDKFITKLEEINNPELVNQVINKIDGNEPIIEFHNNLLNEILEQAKTNPDALKKALKLDSNLFGTKDAVAIFSSKDSKINDEIFDMYLDFKKKNPNCTSNFDIVYMDNLLNLPNTDKKTIENLFSIAKNENFYFKEIASLANEHNISYIQECLKKGSITAKDKFFIQALKHNPKNPQDLSKIYDELYLPMQKISKEHNLNEYVLSELIRLKLNGSPIYKELENNKILQLILEKEISPNILTTLHYLGDNSKIPQYILDDVKKIQNGESLIRKFTSKKDAIKQSSAGDVVSVNNQLYINDNGKLSQWNMSEEKFNELFPLVDRFANNQGHNNCYFSTIAKSLYENPKSRGHYYKMFEQKGNDICVTIPAYRDFSGEVVFPNGEIKISDYGSRGAKHFQMLERTYERTAVRGDYFKIKKDELKDPILTDDLEYLNKRIRGGDPIDVIQEIFPDQIMNGEVVVQNIMKKLQAEDVIKSYAGNPRYILTNGTLTWGNNGHVVSIKGYNPQKDTVTISDPVRNGIVEELPLAKALEKFLRLNFVRFR